MREMKRVVRVIGGKETIRMEGRWCEREVTSARETGRRLEKEDFVHCRRKREGTSANIGGVELEERKRGDYSERDGMVVSVTARSSARTVFEWVFFSSSSRESPINEVV